MRQILLVVLLCGCVKPYEPVDISLSYLETADRYFGLHEVEDRQELTEFMNYDPVVYEWCAAFVNAVFREHGIPGSESVSEHPLIARSFLNWGEPVDEPDFGDLVIFDRGSEGWQGHVGFYMGTYGNSYMILGGNQDNRVTYEFYPISRVLGIRRYVE
jgi:uncharacterized protein (TIGR02594 family)